MPHIAATRATPRPRTTSATAQFVSICCAVAPLAVMIHAWLATA